MGRSTITNKATNATMTSVLSMPTTQASRLSRRARLPVGSKKTTLRTIGRPYGAEVRRWTRWPTAQSLRLGTTLILPRTDLVPTDVLRLTRYDVRNTACSFPRGYRFVTSVAAGPTTIMFSASAVCHAHQAMTGHAHHVSGEGSGDSEE